MKVYTRVVLDMTQDDLPVLESESFEYSGPVDLCKPGGKGKESGPAGGGSSGRSSSGGSNRSGNQGVGNRTASRGGMAAENSRGGMGSMGGRSSSGGGSGRGDFGGLSYEGGGFGLGRATSAAARAGADVAGSAMSGGRQGGARSGGSDAMSRALSGVLGRNVAPGVGGYFDDQGTRVAYGSGQPTSYGAHYAGRNQDQMSWQGARAVSDAAMNVAQQQRKSAALAAMQAVEDKIKAMPFSAVQDRLLDALHTGRFGDLTAYGLMSKEQETAVRNALEGPMDRISRGLGQPVDDLTTGYESFVRGMEKGLMSPDGSLTAKGWMGVASPALGIATGPLAGLAYGAAGLPGALAAIAGLGAAQTYAGTAASMASPGAQVASAVTNNLGMGPLAGGLSYADSMQALSQGQQFAGRQPSAPGPSAPVGGADGGFGARSRGGGVDLAPRGMDAAAQSAQASLGPVGGLNPWFVARQSGVEGSPFA